MKVNENKARAKGWWLTEKPGIVIWDFSARNLTSKRHEFDMAIQKVVPRGKYLWYPCKTFQFVSSTALWKAIPHIRTPKKQHFLKNNTCQLVSYNDARFFGWPPSLQEYNLYFVLSPFRRMISRITSGCLSMYVRSFLKFSFENPFVFFFPAHPVHVYFSYF